MSRESFNIKLYTLLTSFAIVQDSLQILSGEFLVKRSYFQAKSWKYNQHFVEYFIVCIDQIKHWYVFIWLQLNK